MSLKYTKTNIVSLKSSPDFTERWVQERIAEDPTILGLGNLELKDVERLQPRAGRLDLLLHNPDTDERYELELMLGVVDESHIIRTIEYWDNERKRYPQYDHKAVIVAEEITSRFLNVISLFNQTIPIIALQMNALQVDDKIALHFAKVLDEIIPGEDDEDEVAAARNTDREYWEHRPLKKTLPMVDECFSILREVAPDVTLNYRSDYIGLTQDGRSNNFIGFHPRMNFLGLNVRIPEEQGWRGQLEQAGFDVLETKRRDRVRFHLRPGDVQSRKAVLHDLFAAAYAAQMD